MVRFLQIPLLAILFLSAGCAQRSDYRFQKEDSSNQKTQSKTEKNLAELEEPFSSFDYSSFSDQYTGALPPGITITKFRNFLIFSQLAQDTTYDIINKDIRWTIDAMTNNYIKTLPDKLTSLFLFSNVESYKNFAVDVFNTDESDLSPYGFYKISKNVIVIRFVSWKGSPSHEVTHAMIQNDFPDIPSWFNEGLAALNEKSIYKNGQLIGDFSWRIISLRRAFNENTYTGLSQLMNTNDEELYSKRSSFYYAQSRYFLMYIQEKGLLTEYYKYFRDNYEKDHTGIQQIIRITHQSIDELDKELIDYISSFTRER